jgi:hypothetical protein
MRPSRATALLAWIGPLIAVPGLLSYFTTFSMWPAFRDFPWLNLLILVAAVMISALAVRRAEPGLGRLGSVAGLVVSLSALGLLCFYCFFLSYQLPDAGRVADDGTRIPNITLVAQDGEAIDLADAARDKLILVFYRGHW